MTETYTPTDQDRQSVKMQPDMLKISGDGAFFTVQGEGESIGKPAVFLRLNFCNLQCGWCDTKYTWDVTSKEFWTEGQDWSYEKAVLEISQYPAKRLVITGGEPMLQQDRIGKLIELLPEWEIEIETNGTIAPSEELTNRCQFNVSPKLENSDNSIEKRLKPDILKKFNDQARSTFKFVVQDKADLDEVDRIVEACGLDQAKILIMPEGISEEDIRQHALQVIEGVKTRGWRLTPRLQVMLWGDERGV